METNFQRALAGWADEVASRRRIEIRVHKRNELAQATEALAN